MKRVNFFMVIEIVLECGHTVIVKFNSGDLDYSLAVCQMKDDVSLVQYLRGTYLHDLVPEIYAVDYTRNAGLQWVMMEKVGGVMVMDAYRAWRRVESDEAKLRMSHAIRELASAYAKLFELRLCDSHGDHIADDNHQHHHSTSMPEAFDITISYEPCSDVNSEIQRARNARQRTATYIAHRFWHLMHDSPFSAEKLAENHIPADHMDALRKLKALVPFLLPPVNQYMAHDTVLGSRRIHHPDLSSTNVMLDADTGALIGIIDWECITTAPAEISAAYPEWIRYDGESHALTFWSQKMVFVDPVYHAESRYIFERVAAEVSPAFVTALKAGQPIRELVDWAEKILCAGGGGKQLKDRLIAVHRWIENKACALGVTFPDDAPRRKEEWQSLHDGVPML